MFSTFVIVHDLDLVRVALAESEAARGHREHPIVSGGDPLAGI
jgi:hypothetical protein